MRHAWKSSLVLAVLLAACGSDGGQTSGADAVDAGDSADTSLPVDTVAAGDDADATAGDTSGAGDSVAADTASDAIGDDATDVAGPDSVTPADTGGDDVAADATVPGDGDDATPPADATAPDSVADSVEPPDAVGDGDTAEVCVAVPAIASELWLRDTSFTAATVYVADATKSVDLGFGGPGPDVVRVEIWPHSAGTDDSNYATCEHCVTVHVDVDPSSGAEAALMFQRTGSIGWIGDPSNPATMIMLDGYVFEEVTQDPDTFATTPVSGGACATLEHTTFPVGSAGQ
ncbi:MAG: hypothetical protein U1F43_09700 [Myxococcota bacterium]